VTTFDAIYRGGALHPLAPLGLAEGTPVRVTLESAAAPPQNPLDPAEVLARIRAIAALSDPTAPVEHTARDHDKILYGSGGAR
jgi:predicted DNA-binding antitoxin AbrB/MazE fold protein